MQKIFILLLEICVTELAPDVISILSGCLIAWNLCNIVATL